MLFFYLANMVQLVIGVIILAIVATWKHQRGKGLMMAAVALWLIALPLLSFVSYFAFQWLQSTSNFRALQTVSTIVQGLSTILNITSGVLILCYVLVVAKAQNSSGIAPGHSPHGVNAARWDVSRDPATQIQIMRKREWGFLLDCLPMVLVGVVSVMISAWQARQSSFYSLSELLVNVSTMAGVFFVPYIILKDSFGGVSLGKYFTGCRVVDENGHAISAGKSALRNFLFLFPFMPLVELVIASFRKDRRRLGDLMANTFVVTGPPGNSTEIPGKPIPVEEAELVKKHPLDD